SVHVQFCPEVLTKYGSGSRSCPYLGPVSGSHPAWVIPNRVLARSSSLMPGSLRLGL
uniref:Uncharacterized protein n=1 Tax=Cannabis sativa TaxID=3483 RepID=A0A803QRD2_CANSA